MLKNIEIEIPLTPNFIRTKNGYSMPIKNFTDNELKKVGKLWTQKLIENAHKLKIKYG